MSAHATRSPSGASGWLACAGWASSDTSSKHSREGTAAHELAARCLTEGSEPDSHLGLAIEVEGDTFIVDSDMALAVGDYTRYVRDVTASTGGELLVEQCLPIEGITGETDAHGTSDAVILAPDELIIADLKFGRGVPVEADDNPQLQIYALAAMDEFSLTHDFSTVRMVIHQPRLGAVSEWVQTVEQLEAFRSHVGQRIQILDANPDQREPGEKQCRWCANKGSCSALASRVEAEIGADFDDLAGKEPPQLDIQQGLAAHVPAMSTEALSTALQATDLIEIWIKAVRAEVETRLLAGQAVPGFKLVQGKKGNRAWSDEAEAEKLLKSIRLKHEQLYDYSVKSPTQIAKLGPSLDKDGKPKPPKPGEQAPTIGPRQWPKVAALITQADGKPSVAPASDKRPALVMSAVAEDFDDVTASSDACDLA